MSVQVRAILDRKGHEVHTLPPDATVVDAARALQRHNIGALVVSGTGEDVAGIISERDVVRRLASEGEGCLQRTVAEIMTTSVTTCGSDASADELMGVMTASRIRHVPVVEDGRLVGLISIGDVVKSYTDALELRTQALEGYVTGSAY